VSAAGRWFVSPHAIQRFARHALGWLGEDRWALPEALYQQALAEIVRESERAHIVRRYPLKPGHVEADLWRGPKPRRLRYVVATQIPAGQTLPVLITVLPAFDMRREIDRAGVEGACVTIRLDV
jgi:hypothetical protein